MTGRVFSSGGFDYSKWRATTVVKTLPGALVRQGVYRDPYVGTNKDANPDSFSKTSP